MLSGSDAYDGVIASPGWQVSSGSSYAPTAAPSLRGPAPAKSRESFLSLRPTPELSPLLPRGASLFSDANGLSASTPLSATSQDDGDDEPTRRFGGSEISPSTVGSLSFGSSASDGVGPPIPGESSFMSDFNLDFQLGSLDFASQLGDFLGPGGLTAPNVARTPSSEASTADGRRASVSTSSVRSGETPEKERTSSRTSASRHRRDGSGSSALLDMITPSSIKSKLSNASLLNKLTSATGPTGSASSASAAPTWRPRSDSASTFDSPPTASSSMGSSVVALNAPPGARPYGSINKSLPPTPTSTAPRGRIPAGPAPPLPVSRTNGTGSIRRSAGDVLRKGRGLLRSKPSTSATNESTSSLPRQSEDGFGTASVDSRASSSLAHHDDPSLAVSPVVEDRPRRLSSDLLTRPILKARKSLDLLRKADKVVSPNSSGEVEPPRVSKSQISGPMPIVVPPSAPIPAPSSSSAAAERPKPPRSRILDSTVPEPRPIVRRTSTEHLLVRAASLTLS